MSDLNSYIREKYHQEVQPQYSEDAWERFAAYADLASEKKERKFLVFLIWGMLVLLVAGGALYAFWPKSSHSIHYREVQDTPLTAGAKDDGLSRQEMSPDVTTFKEENKTILQDNVNDFNTERRALTIYAPGGKKKNHTEEMAMSVGKIKGSGVGESPIIHGQGTEPESSAAMVEQVDPVPVLPSVAMVAPLEGREYAITYESNFLPLEKEILSLHRQADGGKWSLSLETGTGRSYHRSIESDASSLLDFVGAYHLRAGLRVTAMMGIQHSSFTSKVLNRNLGLRSINYPVREARLENVVSTTTYLETAIGLEYHSPQMAGFHMIAGSGMAFLQELSRNFDYEFSQGDAASEKVNISDANHRSHPLNFLFNAGISYQIRHAWNISLKGEYLKGWNRSEVQLPDQVRIKLGLTKNL